MTKDQKDLAWVRLPKGVRDEMRANYASDGSEWEDGYKAALKQYFGHHNLTSATEPEEMLMVSKSKVMERIRYLYSHPAHMAAYKADERASELRSLFGDKCLSDKEQPKPKFKIGDKVKVLENSELVDYRNRIATIVKRGECCKGYGWVLDISKSVFLESELEPYTEENKETMEAKELNLCELLKGCEGECFYVMPCGEMELKEINNKLKPLHFSKGAINCLTKTDGRAYEDGSCIIYPSRALYEKYPLDAYSAWMEWKDARKPKRWTPQIGERFFFVNAAGTVSQDFCRSEIESNGMQLKRRAIGNEFQTGKDAEAFAKIFREALTKFHENHTEK